MPAVGVVPGSSSVRGSGLRVRALAGCAALLTVAAGLAVRAGADGAFAKYAGVRRGPGSVPWPDPCEPCPSGHSWGGAAGQEAGPRDRDHRKRGPGRRPAAARAGRRPRIHRAWIVAAVTFVTIIGGAAFNSLPGLLIDPLHTEFGWSRGEIGLAISIDLALYGLTAPFAAALMDRFGIRRVVAVALTMVAAGALASVWMTASWQLMIYWGLLVGLGTGSMAMAFAATVTNRWFVARRGLVTGVLTAAGASGQLVFLPLCAWIVSGHGWRPASVTVALAALVVVPLVWLLMRDHPADVGLAPYGGVYVAKPAPARAPPAAR